ncbi:acetylornithine deacetylase [Escherichia coli]|uniref:Acetylornithine deacetylase n=1 Tax=Escherichia coli TaxID=562 RepID=A0A376LFE8_ECOLX|nr:acetylornithine deacetylase [Escherichia coli]
MDIRPLPSMTLNELNGLLNDALAPVSETLAGSSDGRRAASADPWL